MPPCGWQKLDGCPMLVGPCCHLSTSFAWDCLTLWTFLCLWTPGVSTDWSACCYCPVGVEFVALHCCYVCPKNCNTALSFMLHPQACMSHQVCVFLPPLHCWGLHSQCQQVHVIVWAIQHHPVAYYATPVSVQLSLEFISTFFPLFFCSWSYSPCLWYYCWHPTVVHVVYGLFCFAFSCASSTITSINRCCIFCWLYHPAQDQRTLHSHTSGARSLGLIASCFLHLAGTLV